MSQTTDTCYTLHAIVLYGVVFHCIVLYRFVLNYISYCIVFDYCNVYY